MAERFVQVKWNFFERITCLALDEDWPEACQELERVGIDGVWRFRPLEIDNKLILGPHQSFNGSTRQMLLDFYAEEKETCLILEADCVFKELDHLEKALSELPIDWDLVYLGGNVREPAPERISEHLFRVRDCWTTHAIGYRRKVIPFLLENQPGFSDEMYDCWMSRQLPNLNAYIVSPMVAWQKPHYSGIWNRFVHYDDIFAESQRRLA